MTRDETLDRLFDLIAQLMNVSDPLAEVNKLIALEMTLNPDTHQMDYTEIMNRIIGRLVNFYQSEELEQLWLDYIFNDQSEEAA
jgi:hypothetical protein